jgi:hypothetical protein
MDKVQKYNSFKELKRYFCVYAVCESQHKRQRRKTCFYLSTEGAKGGRIFNNLVKYWGDKNIKWSTLGVCKDSAAAITIKNLGSAQFSEIHFIIHR